MAAPTAKRVRGYRLDWREDEKLKVYFGRRLVLELNHDEHGNCGMEAAADLIWNLAEIQGIPIKETARR